MGDELESVESALETHRRQEYVTLPYDTVLRMHGQLEEMLEN